MAISINLLLLTTDAIRISEVDLISDIKSLFTVHYLQFDDMRFLLA